MCHSILIAPVQLSVSNDVFVIRTSQNRYTRVLVHHISTHELASQGVHTRPRSPSKNKESRILFLNLILLPVVIGVLRWVVEVLECHSEGRHPPAQIPKKPFSKESLIPVLTQTHTEFLLVDKSLAKLIRISDLIQNIPFITLPDLILTPFPRTTVSLLVTVAETTILEPPKPGIFIEIVV